jgi:hypothetical protein
MTGYPADSQPGGGETQHAELATSHLTGDRRRARHCRRPSPRTDLAGAVGGAEGAHELDVVGAAHGGHLGAEGRGDLHGEHADPAEAPLTRTFLTSIGPASNEPPSSVTRSRMPIRP